MKATICLLLIVSAGNTMANIVYDGGYHEFTQGTEFAIEVGNSAEVVFSGGEVHFVWVYDNCNR